MKEIFELEKLLKFAQKLKETPEEDLKKLNYQGDIEIDLVIKYLSKEIENKN